MKTVAATEAKNRLGAILDAAQREPIVIRRQFLDLRNEVAAEAAKAGLTDEKLADLLNDDDA
jgi:hypothetical protein